MSQAADLLVADIGGTNARFAVSDAEGALHEPRVLHAAKFPKIDEAISAYLSELKCPRPRQACFVKQGEEVASAALRRGIGCGKGSAEIG